jgi:4'-phosphopantetheinyl transferase superfamily
MLLEPLCLDTPEQAPEVRLLDAGSAGAAEQVLRSSARRLSEEAGAPYASRSYRYPYALVAWHSAPVGIDIERVQALDPRFATSICTPAEEVEWTALPDPHAHFSSLWSSKEALAKALGDPVSYDPRRLGGPMFWPRGRAGRWEARSLRAADGHVAWLCWQSSATSRSQSFGPRRPELRMT